MAEGSGDVTRWRDLYRQFIILGNPARACPKPTPDDLNRFEIETGVKLPLSYRSYTHVFGAGVFDLDAVSLRVSVPYCPSAMLDLKESFEINDSFKTTPGVSDRAKRLVYVANSFSGDLFGWDPEDETGAAEFGVYCAIRHGDVVKLADDFYGFITLCLDRSAFRERLHILDVDEDDEDEDDEDEDHAARSKRDHGPRRVFEPATAPSG